MQENNSVQKTIITQEKELKAINGLPILIVNVVLSLAAITGILVAIINFNSGMGYIFMVCMVYLLIVCPLLLIGIKILKPQEALVLILFGKYHGTLKGPGIFFVNPFCTSFAPGTQTALSASVDGISINTDSRKISLKAKTLNSDKQKINDQIGNPIIVDTVVVWRIVDTAKAVFNVENCVEYLSVQCNSTLRSIVSLYPYDTPKEADTDEKTLRGSTQEIAHRLKMEIQAKVETAGLEILEARITNLSYAPEIAAAMLQRQQAAAVIDAKQTIVEGAVDIVEMALRRLNDNGIVELDEERKAAMVSNLLVVLCGNKDAQPVVNSGSLY